MDVGCAYSALSAALAYGTKLSFLAFLEILILLLRPDIVDRKNRVKPIDTQSMLDSYDFIIIGGGSAGSVIANRLSENADWTVLLLEAGDDEPLFADVPLMSLHLQQTEFDWAYRTEPSSNYCLAMNNNQCNWPAGKGLGGGSMHNEMVYVRGNRRDYDGWRDLGNAGWGYDDVLPYFKKSENIRIPELRASPYHGTGGYLTIEQHRYIFPLTKFFLDAGRDLGYDVVDVNGESQVGFMSTPSTMRDGLRCSAAKAFLRSASHRKNLHVSTHSMVEKILVAENMKSAYGVQFRRGDEEYVVHAKNEVILSAGAIKSPQILMLSGIGPKNHLDEVGIQVIHDSPGVGQNLQDHVTMGGLDFLIDESSEISDMPEAESGGSGIVTVSEVKQFMNERDGRLYDGPQNEVISFVNTKYAENTLDYPDIEVAFLRSGNNADGGFTSKRYFGIRDDFYESLYDEILDKKSFALVPMLMHPKSRGYIKLRDGKPNHHPVIVPNYFEDPHDLDVLIEGAKIAHNISQTRTMKMFNARLNPTVIPQCANFTFLSDDYLRCLARHFTLTYYHPTCTCKMGPIDDAMAVVDPRLRVYGVKALRVVDASIMPNIVSGNTNGATIMIAEKAADLIKEDYDVKNEQVVTEANFMCIERSDQRP